MKEFWRERKSTTKFPAKPVSKLNDGKVEVSYQISHEVSEFFPEFFKELETKSAELGISSFGFHTTTLEEVFLKIAQEDSEKTPELYINSNN